MLSVQHSHWKFTIERATESLSVLEIKFFNNGFDDLVAHKQSITGLGLNCQANSHKI